MHPNNYDHYDRYFQDYPDRYMMYFQAYEQFQALCNQKAKNSGPRTRTSIPCEQEVAEQRLSDDYFGEENNPPKCPERIIGEGIV